MKGIKHFWAIALMALLMTGAVLPAQEKSPEIPAAPPVSAPAPAAPALELDPALQRIIDMDNEAQAKADIWIREHEELNKEKPFQDDTLPMRIRDRLDSVEKAYQDYLFSHSENMEARLAYASFLMDTGKDNEAAKEWLRLKETHPGHPVLLNNLGNYFAQKGDAPEAFPYYEEAMASAPREALYVKNLASVVYVFREEAMAYYRLKPQQALLLAQALYRKALLLKPDDFIARTALAQTWYYLTPFEPEKALADWKKAYELASDDSERQGILLHYARVAILSEKFDEAEKQLEEITYARHQELKKTLLNNLNERRKLAQEKSASDSPAPSEAKPESAASAESAPKPTTPSP